MFWRFLTMLTRLESTDCFGVSNMGNSGAFTYTGSLRYTDSENFERVPRKL